MGRNRTVQLEKLGAARRVSASAPKDAWVAYIGKTETPTVGSTVYPASATKDQVRTVFARENGLLVSEVNACRNGFFRENYVKK